MNGERVVMAGGNGFLGKVLGRHLADRDYQVVILSRRPVVGGGGGDGRGRVTQVFWDGRAAGEWVRELDGARAVINLAGRSVNCRYNEANRRAILDSRLGPTRALGEAIKGCAAPPAVWLNSSTATIYKHSLDRAMDEATGEIGATPEAKDAFSVLVAREWERALEEAATPGTRKVAMRTAMVLGPGEGGVFRVLRRLARMGLGGAMAGGRQYVSWIHEMDFCCAVEWLIEHDDLAGPVNLAAPNPVPNRELMASLRRVCGVPVGLPAARWMLEVGAFLLRTETELVLKSRRVIPGRLAQAGFRFRFEGIEDALREIEAQVRAGAGKPASASA